MKDNVKFIKNAIRVVIVGIMILFVASTRLYAANPVNVNIDNIGSFDFSDIPEADTSSDANTKTQVADGARGASEENKNTDKTVPNTTTNKANSSSASKEKIPATGSNAEIIFVVGAIAILSACMVAFRKQSIKLK